MDHSLLLAPLGYHLTWHPYATWLPGDDRGWHRRGDGPRHRPPSRPLAAWCAERLRGRVLVFDDAQIELVRRSIVDSCRRREWEIHALTVQPAHVHVVVTAGASAGSAMQQLKGWATRALREEGGVPHDQPVWADHGSARTLWTRERLRRAIDYVLDDHHRAARRRRGPRP